MKGSITKDPDFKNAYQEKDVLTLRNLLNNINVNYKRSKEPIRTMWQEDKNLINPKQQNVDLPTCFEKFKAMKKVVEELSHTTHRHNVVKTLCKEQNNSVNGLEMADAVKFIADGKERNLGMQLIMNTNCNIYGTLTKDCDR